MPCKASAPCTTVTEWRGRGGRSTRPPPPPPSRSGGRTGRKTAPPAAERPETSAASSCPLFRKTRPNGAQSRNGHKPFPAQADNDHHTPGGVIHRFVKA